jgi:hypothetical protein
VPIEHLKARRAVWCQIFERRWHAERIATRSSGLLAGESSKRICNYLSVTLASAAKCGK